MKVNLLILIVAIIAIVWYANWLANPAGNAYTVNHSASYKPPPTGN